MPSRDLRSQLCPMDRSMSEATFVIGWSNTSKTFRFYRLSSPD